jgi:hypothetical protein
VKTQDSVQMIEQTFSNKIPPLSRTINEVLFLQTYNINGMDKKKEQ